MPACASGDNSIGDMAAQYSTQNVTFISSVALKSGPLRGRAKRAICELIRQFADASDSIPVLVSNCPLVGLRADAFGSR